MAELEQVERLREKANVTFAEAKEALDAADGDMLDALIYLESQGKTAAPSGGGYFTSAGTEERQKKSGGGEGKYTKNGESFCDMLKRFGRFCLNLINKGNNNFLDAERHGEHIFSCPVTVVVVLLMFFFWVVIPLFIVSLFFGYRYRFRGAELGREAVNKVMDGATDMAEEIKRTFAEGESKDN